MRESLARQRHEERQRARQNAFTRPQPGVSRRPTDPHPHTDCQFTCLSSTTPTAAQTPKSPILYSPPTPTPSTLPLPPHAYSPPILRSCVAVCLRPQTRACSPTASRQQTARQPIRDAGAHSASLRSDLHFLPRGFGHEPVKRSDTSGSSCPGSSLPLPQPSLPPPPWPALPPPLPAPRPSLPLPARDALTRWRGSRW